MSRRPLPAVVPAPEAEDGEARNLTVDRALRVLEAFLSGDADLGVLELARQLELDKSVIHRILSTLVRRRFIEQDPVSRRYRIGLRVWELGQRYQISPDLEELATSALSKLVSRLPYCTAYLAVLDGGDVVVMRSLRGPGPINLYIDPGTRLPGELTATGRALLAQLDDREVTRLVEQRRAAGLGGRPPRSHLAGDLAAIRTQGYSVGHGEYALGVGTVAATIVGPDERPLAAMTIDFLIAPETESLWEVLPLDLIGAVREIEQVLKTRPVD